MNYYNKILKINMIRDALQDEESKILFDARIDYMINRDESQYYQVLDTLEKNWYCKELNDILGKIKVEGIIIYGGGNDGRRIKDILKKCGYFPAFFCDSDRNKVGKIIDGLKVISLENLLKKYRNYLVILGSVKYAKEICYMLMFNKFPAENILCSQYGMIVAQQGMQYFDVFTANENEVFVDGGAYNGDTILDFITWTGEKKYKKIYAFEPIDKMLQCIMEKTEKKYSKIELYKNVLWNKKESLNFLESGSGSCVSGKGETFIDGVRLDDIIKDEKITFLKLDVEGSELKALEGAKQIIKKNKPRLAICVYHKPEDIIDLPLYILDLVPEYKLYLRHYFFNMCETVLYAER